MDRIFVVLPNLKRMNLFRQHHKINNTRTSDAILDVITSNLMFSTHHLIFDVSADESDVKQSWLLGVLATSLQTTVANG